MADVHLPAMNWNKLRESANCFVPRMTKLIATHSVTYADIARAGRKVGNREFSQHVVGKMGALSPKTHAKCQEVVAAWNRLSADRPGLPELNDRDIVVAAFRLPELKSWMRLAGNLEVDMLAAAAGVRRAVVVHALGDGDAPKHGRVTGGIAHVLHSALAAATGGLPASTKQRFPSLDEFADSTPNGERKIPEGVFDLDDLLKPLPDPLPTRWAP